MLKLLKHIVIVGVTFSINCAGNWLRSLIYCWILKTLQSKGEGGCHLGTDRQSHLAVAVHWINARWWLSNSKTGLPSPLLFAVALGQRGQRRGKNERGFLCLIVRMLQRDSLQHSGIFFITCETRWKRLGEA